VVSGCVDWRTLLADNGKREREREKGMRKKGPGGGRSFRCTNIVQAQSCINGGCLSLEGQFSFESRDIYPLLEKSYAALILLVPWTSGTRQRRISNRSGEVTTSGGLSIGLAARHAKTCRNSCHRHARKTAEQCITKPRNARTQKNTNTGNLQKKTIHHARSRRGLLLKAVTCLQLF
jgi:hypothetical protein